MVHNKTRISKQQAAAVGMLSSEAGLAAMHAVLAARQAERAAMVGAASLGYWRSLLAGIQQLPHMYSALDLRPAAAPQLPAAPAAAAPLPTKAAAMQQDTALSAAAIEAAVQQVVATVLGSEAVDPEQPLAAQGMDSLAGLELRQKIQVRWGGGMPGVRVWQPMGHDPT